MPNKLALKTLLLCRHRGIHVYSSYFPLGIKEIIWEKLEDEFRFRNLLYIVEKLKNQTNWSMLSANNNVTWDMILRSISEEKYSNKFHWKWHLVFANKNIAFKHKKCLMDIMIQKKTKYLGKIFNNFQYAFHHATFAEMMTILGNPLYKQVKIQMDSERTLSKDIQHNITALFFYQKNVQLPHFGNYVFYIHNLKEFCLEFVRTEVFEKAKYRMKRWDWHMLPFSTSFREIMELADKYPKFFRYLELEPKMDWYVVSRSKKNTFEDLVSMVKDARFVDKIDWPVLSRKKTITLNDFIRSQTDPELSGKFRWEWESLECTQHMPFDTFHYLYLKHKDVVEKIHKSYLYRTMSDINITNLPRLMEIMNNLGDGRHIPDLLNNTSVTYEVFQYLLKSGYSEEPTLRWYWISSGTDFDSIKKSLQDPELAHLCKWDSHGICNNLNLTMDNIKELIYNPIFLPIFMYPSRRRNLDWETLSQRGLKKTLFEILDTYEHEDYEWKTRDLRYLEFCTFWNPPEIK